MNEHKSVPNIRFKGFEANWREKKLNTLVNRKSHITSSNSLCSIEYENISPYNHEILKQFNNKKGIYFQKGDILFGKLRPYLKKYVLATYEGKAVGDFWVLAPKKDIYSQFVFYLIQTYKFYLISNLSSGTKMPRSDWNLVNNSFFSVCIIKEQQKIGNLFFKLDKLLDLQQQKINKLELLKKALLQKLFPKDNSKIPELRFKGFKDEWQEKKLSYVVEIIMGQSPSSINYYDTPIENSMILIQGNADIKHHNVKPRVWTTQITKITIPKDVLLTVRAPVGEVAKNKYEAVIGRGMAALRGNDFLYYNLEKLKMIGHWERLSTGSTFESISSNDIRDTKIKMPSYKEQKRVYSLFSKVDQLIELENKKLHNLQQVKKCLLQNMFVE